MSPVPTTPAADDEFWPDVKDDRPVTGIEAGQCMNAPEFAVVETSDSETSSDESEAEQIISELATTDRSTSQWHPGCDLYQHSRSKLVHAMATFGHRRAFICGRSLSKEYRPFMQKFFVDAMKCQQCDKGQAPTPDAERFASAGAAFKRARHG